MSRSLKHLKAVLVDLSGTLHIDKQPIAGSHEALAKLRRSNLKVKFVTNTTKECLNSLYLRLQDMDFDIKLSEIFTSLTAARRLVESKGMRPYLMLTDSAKQDFEGLTTDEPNCVVMGLSPGHFEYESMNKALNLLLGGCDLIAINKARYFKRTNDLALGTGAFVTALEFATDKQAIVVGKPEKRFFHSAIEDLGCKPDECVMVGDDVRDDVGGAINAGMHGILVKTGKYLEGDETKINLPSERVATNFSAAVDLILNSR
uniref:Haloacid dehalogenase-like hydrolase domain-containing protein 2 n=1 Tax=Phallusia mammillata TaxID=59560 RepID=A0A6F9DF10_9ASCI|nr:haloacid dehalogenase-like hydrolase domain-containing protein 2 [Phallusia mammillata]